MRGILLSVVWWASGPLRRRWLLSFVSDRQRPVGERSWLGRIKPLKEIWAGICLRAMGRRSGPGVE